VGQRHVAGAGIIELAQQAQGVVDRIAALHADQAGDAAGPVDAADVVGGSGDLEHRRMGGGDALDRVDLLKGGLGRLDRLQAGGDIDRPELGADAARAKAWDIGMEARRRRQIGRQINTIGIVPEALTQGPGQVVVAVDQGGAAQDLHHPLLPRSIVAGRGLRQGGPGQDGERNGGEQGGADHGGPLNTDTATLTQAERHGNRV